MKWSNCSTSCWTNSSGSQQNDVSIADLGQSGGGQGVAQSGFQSRSVRMIQGLGQVQWQAMAGHGQVQLQGNIV